MSLPQRPTLDAADDLTAAADIDIGTALRGLIEQRVLSPIVRPSKAAEVSAMIDDSFPGGGDTLAELAAQITRATERYPRRNTHPGFFGWLAPSGLPSDPLAHAMVGALNENVGGYWASPTGTTIERAVVRWLADLAGFPSAAEGVMLSGGSMANMCGLACALARYYGPRYRTQGLGALAREAPPLIVCSRETHFSIRRAAAMLGVGTDNVVVVDCDDRFRMRVDALEAVLAERQKVACVVATAGTTNTGAIDPLDDIADLCSAHGVWLHVDAAYGGGGLMSAELRPRYRGIDRADSLVMDLHKWFYQALDGSLLLYRDATAARSLFYDTTDYLTSSEQPAPEQYMFFHIAPELSRRFRALPFYISMRHYGIERLGRNALHNVQCARYLAELVDAHQQFELIAAPQLSILCFRFRPAGLDDAAVDRLNVEIRDRVQLEGEYLMSPTLVRGRPVLRVSIINHATRAEHVEGLFDSIVRIGRALLEC